MNRFAVGVAGTKRLEWVAAGGKRSLKHIPYKLQYSAMPI
jgi:hypothetical protein